MNSSDKVDITLDGRACQAPADASVWSVALAMGVELPHLCHQPDGPRGPGLRAAGNCCACLVEIEGEGRLAAACRRRVEPGMTVRTDSARALQVRALVLELLASDAGARLGEPAATSELGSWARRLGVDTPRFVQRAADARVDVTHPDIAIDMGACIQCTRCLRACREEQGHKVIGLAYRGGAARIVFDDDVPIGDSSCVSCMECVRVCPTGALAAVRKDSG
jgi:formate dehydrogenase major subunit